MTQSMLDSVTVVSFFPGRIRFHLGFKGDEILGDFLRREVTKIEFAQFQAYSNRTRNALVTYDASQVSDVTIAQAMLQGVREFIRVHGECDLENHERQHEEELAHVHSGDDCDHDHSATSTDAGIRKELFKLTLTGGVLGYFVYRKISGKRTLFEGNPLLDVASLVTIISGYTIFRDGMKAVQKNKKATDDTLIGIAVLATILMGESLTGLSVVWLINLGRLLEAITLKRSRTAIKDLMDVTPKEAWLVVGTGPNARVERTPVEKIKKGQIIRVFESEKVPLDGKVMLGSGYAKEDFITGESIPKEKILDSSVYAGSLLENGQIDLSVTNLFNETVVARMINAIENVRDHKAPIERIGDKFASNFVPISLGLAGATLLATGDVKRAITMLVIACPCAAGLATPTAVSASIGQAARRGILIKGGTYIEAAAKIDTVIFDKTGTLTNGTPELHKLILNGTGKEVGESELLRLAASAEQYSTHPLGLALVKEAKKKSLALSVATSHKVHPGLGIHAVVGDREIHIGNQRFLNSVGVAVPAEVETQAKAAFVAGESLVHIAVDRNLLGTFLLQDQVRPEAKEMLESLKRLGVKNLIMATGDQKISAEYVAERLGFTEVHAELMPHQKLELVSALQKEGKQVAMVGDGINDAQAFAQADLSIAMGGSRCDIAIETADITLARNDLRLVADVFDISQKTLRTIYQNFVASVGINAGGMVFGAFGKLSPFAAAIVHNASTIVVVLNSLRLGKEVAKSNPLSLIGEIKI
jgi:cation-transporting P-type ATPase C